MQYRKFGRTGLSVSRLCLGTMTFGLQTEEAVSHGILDRAAEAGVNFIDTADVYPLGGTEDLAGRTEEIVGRWLKGKRERFIVATKAQESGASLTKTSLAWVLANPLITSAIIGASKPEQLTDTRGAIDLTLDAGLKAKLDDATHEYRWGDAAR